MTQCSPLPPLLILVCWILLAGRCYSEDAQSDAISEEHGRIKELETVDVREGDEVIALFGMLCAIALSLISICVGYFSLLEDGLMRIFSEYGIDVRATVVEAQFLRGAVGAIAGADFPTGGGKEEDNVDGRTKTLDARNEYNVVIKYMAPGMDPKEPCTVTKQLKVLKSDLVEPPKPLPRSFNISPEGVCPPAQLIEEANTIIAQPSGLDILVLRSHPTSAVPRRQAERLCTVRYRLPTVLLVLFLIALYVFCVYLSIATMPNFPLFSSRAKATFVVTAVLFTVEVVGVHLFLGNIFRDALKELYLEGGALAATTWIEETATLSSQDDFYAPI